MHCKTYIARAEYGDMYTAVYILLIVINYPDLCIFNILFNILCKLIQLTRMIPHYMYRVINTMYYTYHVMHTILYICYYI